MRNRNLKDHIGIDMDVPPDGPIHRSTVKLQMDELLCKIKVVKCVIFSVVGQHLPRLRVLLHQVSNSLDQLDDWNRFFICEKVILSQFPSISDQ